MSRPISFGVLKSKGVPATGSSRPVVRPALSFSVKRSAKHLQRVMENGTCSVEVEEAVICQIKDRIRVGLGVVGQRQRIVVGERDGRRHREVAGVILLAVRRQTCQHQPPVLFRGMPDILVEALYAAVQVVSPIVARKTVRPAVQGEFAVADSVGETTDDGAGVGLFFLVFPDCMIPKDHVGF